MYLDGQSILVVMHDAARLEQIAGILAREGFAVAAAAEGLAALRAVAAQDFTLIVTARRLPGSLDGVETVRQARTRRPRLKALYVDDGVLRPIHGNPETDDVIAMPFERHELIGCVFELLNRGSAMDLGRRVRTELKAS